MAAPSYTEDLTDLNLSEAATGWVELTGTIGGEAYNANGTPAGADGDYPFIQGSFSVTQDCTKNTSVGSLAYDNGAGTGGHGTDGAYFVWQNYMVASNIGTYAQGGFQVAVGSSAADYYVWYVGGVDKSPYPYGGWVNNVANTTVTVDGTAGTPTATEQFIGSAVYVSVGSSKGEVHNVDAIRYGRGSAIFEHGDLTNGYATFAGFATQNDLNANRWGLIAETAGGYLWKGRMQIGTVTNAADFRDSGVNVFIQWTPKVTANFNLIEIINASTNVAWTGITFTCLDTTTASKGRLLMTDNATVALNSCTFNDMDTFVFLSNATATSSNFNRCGIVTTGGGTFTSCLFDNPTGASAVLAATLSDLVTCSFVSDGSSHAVELSTIGAGTMTWDATTSGFDSGATGSPVTPTSTGNEDIYVNVATASDLTINVATGATIPSIRVGASFTGSVNVVAGQVTTTITVKDINTGTELQGARVYLVAAAGGPLTEGTVIFNTTTDVNGQVTDTRSLASAQPVVGRVRHSTSPNFYKTSPINETISNTTGLSLNVALIPDN